AIRLPDGPAGMEHPCSSPTFRPHPCGLSWQTHSVQRCEMPAPERPQPAGQLPCALLEKDGKGHRASSAVEGYSQR
ncbi:hypothetical protein, partial [Pantoea latae]|uniref:hypothetical protein n=1 Tax=Pantoea latae TaxID=1964541 RepID=UPI001F293CFD